MVSTAAIAQAFQAAATPADLDHAQQAYGRWGAHRAYLAVIGLNGDYGAAAKRQAAKLCKAAGVALAPAYGSHHKTALYLGYDNFEGGRLAARGEAVARALKALGVEATVFAHGD